jgi:cytochrome c oxidase subunit 2
MNGSFDFVALQVLAPAGPQATRIANLWWYLLSVNTAVWVLVMGVLSFAIWRRRRRSSQQEEGWLKRNVTIATVLTALILVSFYLATVRTGNALRGPLYDPLDVSIVGHQWWWEVSYPNDDPSQAIITANEIHIPVGRQVRLHVTSRDVIHSFWAPQLHGKMDLIPGKTNVIWVQADYPGEFRGRCAEFCGFQHAHMQFTVVAQTPSDFTKWIDQQRQQAHSPDNEERQRGQKVFLSASCVLCHTIRGTDANGMVAPDLTHVGSRKVLAAGAIPNTRGHIAGWVTDSQRLKPGNYMPPMNLDSKDVQPLAAYLESLQ